MASTTPLRFDIYKGDQIIQTVTLEQTPIKIGKLPSSHLRIDDQKVSRIHAVIEPARDEGFHIIDLGSSSGTFVNGAKVNKQRLNSGDEITLGDTKIVVVIESESEAESEATMLSSLDALGAAAAPMAAAPMAHDSNEVFAGGGIPNMGPMAGLPAANPATNAGFAMPSAPPAFGGAPSVFGLPQQGFGQSAMNPLAAGGFGVAQGQLSASPFGLPQPAPAPAPVVMAPAPQPVRQQAKPKDNFERRFLSESYKGGAGALEVALLWRGNLFHIDQYKKAANITIGSSADATYAVEAAAVGPIRPFALHAGGEWTLYFTDEMDGFILVDPKKTGGKEKLSLKEAAAIGLAQRSPDGWALPLSGSTRAKISVGDVVFLIHYISLPVLSMPLIALGGAAGASLIVSLITFGVSFLLHSGFWVLVSFTTDRVDALTIDQLMSDSAFAEALITPEQEEEEEPEEQEDKDEEDAPEEDEGARAAEEEGDVGKPDETALEGKFAIEGNDDNMALRKAYNTQVAMGTGVLSASEEMESLLGGGLEAAGYDAVSAWGEFDSTAAAGNTAGNYGLGMSGAGRGGGGSNVGGFGVGRFGTAGRGGGGSGGRNYGSAAASLGDKAVGAPKLKPGRPDVSGSLDKRIIRKVVNQHKREIKACYEKELAKKKGLFGKVVVKWTIDQSGNVPSAVVVSTTMNNKEVEKCLSSAISYWRFPAPRGGGLVIVSYPFVFEVGN